jgi:hypothetical protein
MRNGNKKVSWFWKALAIGGIVIAGAQIQEDQEELERLREEVADNEDKTLDELIEMKMEEENDELLGDDY